MYTKHEVCNLCACPLSSYFVLALLQDKKSLKLGPDDNLHLEGFALNVFAKADKQDRAGRADLYGSSLLLHHHSLLI